MSPDKHAAIDPTSAKAAAGAHLADDPDEDLFDFDGVAGKSAQVAEDMHRELDEALTQVEHAKEAVAQTVVPSSRAQAATIIPAAPAAHAGAQPASVVQTVVHQKLTMSPVAGALLGAVVLANVVLMMFAWNSVSATKEMVLDVAHEVRETSSDLREESERRTANVARASEPVFGTLPEGYQTLEVARRRIAAGEYERARRALFSLLAVIDRLEPPARGEIEAQANFLIADSFEQQALRAAPAAEGGQK